MAGENFSNIIERPAYEPTPNEFASMREPFLKWLYGGYSKKYSLEVITPSLDEASSYAMQSKIISHSIWCYSKPHVFKPIFYRLLAEKSFRSVIGPSYGTFIVAGRLYLSFLEELPWENSPVEATVEISEPVIADTDSDFGAVSLDGAQTSAAKSAAIRKDFIMPELPSSEKINPKDVIAWLITQPNANGTLYSEHVARAYMEILRVAPSKLSSIPIESRNVFSCCTVAELDALWSVYKNDSNYAGINRKVFQGRFSVGMGTYRRYLEHLKAEDKNKSSNTGCGGKGDELLVVTLDSGINCSLMMPELLRYFDEAYEVSSWTDLYMRACTCLLDDYPAVFAEMAGKSGLAQGYVAVAHRSNPKLMTAPKAISEEYYVETGGSGSALLQRLILLLEYCRVDRENLEISCRYNVKLKDSVPVQNDDAFVQSEQNTCVEHVC